MKMKFSSGVQDNAFRISTDGSFLKGHWNTAGLQGATLETATESCALGLLAQVLGDQEIPQSGRSYWEEGTAVDVVGKNDHA